MYTNYVADARVTYTVPSYRSSTVAPGSGTQQAASLHPPALPDYDALVETAAANLDNYLALGRKAGRWAADDDAPDHVPRLSDWEATVESQFNWLYQLEQDDPNKIVQDLAAQTESLEAGDVQPLFYGDRDLRDLFDHEQLEERYRQGQERGEIPESMPLEYWKAKEEPKLLGEQGKQIPVKGNYDDAPRIDADNPVEDPAFQ